MARTTTRPKASREKTLHTRRTRCPTCHKTVWSAYVSHRTVSTLEGVYKIHLHVRRCRDPSCTRYHKPFRPEAEGRIALPQHGFGLDVIALIGALRYQQHRSVPEIHKELVARKLEICERSVTNLLDRYDELVSIRLSDNRRLQTITKKQGRVILALDGLQPDVGHEVLWLLRDCLSGEVLLARSLPSSTERNLAGLIREVKRNLPVPIVGAISDSQRSIRKAVASALPRVAHQLCHFPYLREAAKPIYEADRHPKKELMKRICGIQPIERQVERTSGREARSFEDTALVRSAITDDGLPPLQARGLKLWERPGRKEPAFVP